VWARPLRGSLALSQLGEGPLALPRDSLHKEGRGAYRRRDFQAGASTKNANVRTITFPEGLYALEIEQMARTAYKPPPGFLTIPMSARLLNISEAMFRRLAKRHELVPIMVRSAMVKVFKTEDVERLGRFEELIP